MNERNTGKAKLNRNKNFPYKYRKICLKCGRTYGVDHDLPNENNRCPLCSFGKKASRFRAEQFDRGEKQ